jgi:hypothetical protein
VAIHEYGTTDFQYITAGAAILASGGDGSYCDAVTVLQELVDTAVIKVNAAPKLYKTPGVVASFAGLLQSIGYAGTLPYSG